MGLWHSSHHRGAGSSHYIHPLCVTTVMVMQDSWSCCACVWLCCLLNKLLSSYCVTQPLHQTLIPLARIRICVTGMGFKITLDRCHSRKVLSFLCRSICDHSAAASVPCLLPEPWWWCVHSTGTMSPTSNTPFLLEVVFLMVFSYSHRK